MGRFMVIYWRTPSYNLTRFLIAFGLAVIFGLVLINGHYTTYQGLNSAVGVIFMTALYQSYISYVGCLPFTARERVSYYRERDAQTYSAFWYFVGATVVEIPFVFGSGLTFTVIFFPLMGIGAFGTAVLYWINVSLFVLMETYLGQMFIYALPTVEVAAIVGVFVNAIFLLFAGFNPPAASIPTGYIWVYYLTPHRYSMAILIALLFGDCPVEPTYDEATQSYTNVASQLGCQPLENAPLSIGHTTVKNYIADVFKIEHDDIWSNFGYVFLYIAAIRGISLLSLRYLNHQKR